MAKELEGVLIDDDIRPYYDLFRWRIVHEGTNAYVKADLPDFLARHKSIKLHHLVLYWVDKKRRLPGRDIDHINGNGLDNRRENLRMVTSRENHWNMKKTRGVSKYMGVYRNGTSRKNPWTAGIRNPEGKHEYLGAFPSEKEAAEAYDRAALKQRGPMARLNFREVLPEGR